MTRLRDEPAGRRRRRAESRLTAATIVLLVASSLFGEIAMLWRPVALAATDGGVAEATTAPPTAFDPAASSPGGPSGDPSGPAATASTASGNPAGSPTGPATSPAGSASSPTGPASSPTGPASSSPGATPTGRPATATPIAGATPTPRPATPRPTIAPPPHQGDYLVISSTRLAALPTSGSAWAALIAVADGSLGSADLSDQDSKHGVRTLAVALAYARTGLPAYRDKARAAIVGAVGTERPGAHNSVLALGRQLAAYVLAADLIALDGADDQRFREWLAAIRTRQLGGHGRWDALVATHEDSMNNWGSFAGAARIAASLYLGDDADVARAARVARGFLGDGGSWSAWQPLTEEAASWSCDPTVRVPVNGSCVVGGIDVDGAIVADVSRGGMLAWPPVEPGIAYTLETLQGLVLQVELLERNGFPDAWQWSNAALRRVALLVNRSAASGGEGWTGASVNAHLPWILNARYGLAIPTRSAGYGRTFGYTDWLYGTG